MEVSASQLTVNASSVEDLKPLLNGCLENEGGAICRSSDHRDTSSKKRKLITM